MSTLVKHRVWISPITGALGVDNGLHSLVVSLVGAIQNQHTRKSSPLTKDSEPPRNEKDEEEDFGEKSEKLGHRVCMSLSVKIDTGTRSPRGMIEWSLGLGPVLSFPPLSLTSIFDIST